VHYPLCYGEDARDAIGGTTSRTSLRFGERTLQAGRYREPSAIIADESG
jgi:hypothetical protein